MPLSRTSRNAPAANEEWPEIIPDGKPGTVQRVKLNRRAPTPKKVALASVSTQDLRSMKRKDPFMYYSLPGVRSAKLLGKEIDASDLGTSQIRSCPSRLHAWQGSQPSSLVATRSRRISFEICPELLLRDDASTIAEEMEEDQEEEEEQEAAAADPLDLLLMLKLGGGNTNEE